MSTNYEFRCPNCGCPIVNLTKTGQEKQKDLTFKSVTLGGIQAKSDTKVSSFTEEYTCARCSNTWPSIEEMLNDKALFKNNEYSITVKFTTADYNDILRYSEQHLMDCPVLVQVITQMYDAVKSKEETQLN